MPTDMTHEAISARYSNSLSVGTLDNRDYTQSDSSIQTLTSSVFMHDSDANSILNSNTKVKLAIGTRGSIVNFLKFPIGIVGRKGGQQNQELQIKM